VCYFDSRFDDIRLLRVTWAISDGVADLPDQEVDLLFFDNTAPSVETDAPRVLGIAVTRQGIAVRAWSRPSNTADPTTTAGDIALGYRRMLNVERAWRARKQAIDSPPGIGQFTPASSRQGTAQ